MSSFYFCILFLALLNLTSDLSGAKLTTITASDNEENETTASSLGAHSLSKGKGKNASESLWDPKEGAQCYTCSGRIVQALTDTHKKADGVNILDISDGVEQEHTAECHLEFDVLNAGELDTDEIHKRPTFYDWCKEGCMTSNGTVTLMLPFPGPGYDISSVYINMTVPRQSRSCYLSTLYNVHPEVLRPRPGQKEMNCVDVEMHKTNLIFEKMGITLRHYVRIPKAIMTVCTCGSHWCNKDYIGPKKRPTPKPGRGQRLNASSLLVLLSLIFCVM